MLSNSASVLNFIIFFVFCCILFYLVHNTISEHYTILCISWMHAIWLRSFLAGNHPTPVSHSPFHSFCIKFHIFRATKVYTYCVYRAAVVRASPNCCSFHFSAPSKCITAIYLQFRFLFSLLHNSETIHVRFSLLASSSSVALLLNFSDYFSDPNLPSLLLLLLCANFFITHFSLIHCMCVCCVCRIWFIFQSIYDVRSFRASTACKFSCSTPPSSLTRFAYK